MNQKVIKTFRGLFLTVILLGLLPVRAGAVSITVKGSASSPDLATAKKEAVFNARKALLNEHKKIILAWAARCYPDADFDFTSLAQKVSLKASSTIERERVKKHKGTYTVTVYLSYGVGNKDITRELLDSFERNMLPSERKAIKYDHDKAYSTLYDIVKRW